MVDDNLGLYSPGIFWDIFNISKICRFIRTFMNCLTWTLSKISMLFPLHHVYQYFRAGHQVAELAHAVGVLQLLDGFSLFWCWDTILEAAVHVDVCTFSEACGEKQHMGHCCSLHACVVAMRKPAAEPVCMQDSIHTWHLARMQEQILSSWGRCQAARPRWTWTSHLSPVGQWN